MEEIGKDIILWYWPKKFYLCDDCILVTLKLVHIEEVLE